MNEVTAVRKATREDYKKEIHRMIDTAGDIDRLRKIYTVAKCLLEKKATT